MAMYTYAAILICALFEVAKGKSIDEIIMEAALTPKMSMADTFHMNPDGKVEMTVELDIKMDIEQYLELKGDLEQVSRQKRKAVKSTKYRWDECYVYYRIKNDFNAEQVKIIKEAMAEWEKYTCLQFKKATYRNKDRIVFSTGSGGCYSRLGKIGGEQEIGLSRGCVHKGVVIHEIGHAIGWIHEQSRPDRDNYIRVNFHRIPQEWRAQFEKSPRSFINTYHVEYDYKSIMHYSGNAVVPRSIETLNRKYQNVIGQRGGLSFRDIHLANLMYNCTTRKCPKFTQSCRKYGTDAFVFMLDKRCQCVCPNNKNNESPIMPCGSAHTTPAVTSTTTTAKTTTTALRSTTEEPMECMDLRPDCEQLVKDGECKMDMERMLMYCKKSCNFCEKGNMCMDLDSTCPLLALGNFCNRTGFETIMEMRCKKSCGLCTPVSPCEMQVQMGLGLDPGLQASSGHKRSYVGKTTLGLLLLVWTLH